MSIAMLNWLTAWLWLFATVNTTVETRLTCEMTAQSPVLLGQAIRVRFVFGNVSERPLHLLRWGNPFSPRQNDQFEVQSGVTHPSDEPDQPGVQTGVTHPSENGVTHPSEDANYLNSPIPYRPHIHPEPPTPTLRSYKTIPAGERSNATVSLTEGDGHYEINQPGLYTITWRGDLLQIQDGPQPIPHAPLAVEHTHVACNPVRVLVLATPQ